MAFRSTPRTSAQRREKPPPKPLEPARLNELALAYVARFATSAAKLEDYLKRKLRERGWAGDEPPDLSALVARYVEAGYIDDTAYARAKSGNLLRRGYGERRIGQALGAAGIAEDVRAEVRSGVSEQRAAALAMAKKRRFGPFGQVPPERPQREKQLSAMLRAGHPLDSARVLVNAVSVQAAEDWAAEPGDE
jgi:regulatory protein